MMHQPLEAATLEELRSVLREPTSRVLVLTGAGISAASGLATYRGQGGLYAAGGMPPMTARDARSGRLPVLWGHLWPLLEAGRAAAPNAAHHALARYASSRPGAVTLVTQNVDGLHQLAGSETIELHGSLRRVRCVQPGGEHVSTVEACALDEDRVPRCPQCNARTRPDAVLFEEGLDHALWERAEAAAAQADAVLAVGTSLQVFPAAALVVDVLERGKPGGWLELDVERAKTELGLGAAVLARLVGVAGRVEETLPELLGVGGA